MLQSPSARNPTIPRASPLNSELKELFNLIPDDRLLKELEKKPLLQGGFGPRYGGLTSHPQQQLGQLVRQCDHGSPVRLTCVRRLPDKAPRSDGPRGQLPEC